MQRSLLRCGIIKTLTRSIVTHGRRSIEERAEIQRTLAAYPPFQFNDESSQHLGPQSGDEVILTLSGGVDSSVSAYLALQEDGLIPHRTIFMRNWNSLEERETFEPGSGGSQGCQWQRDWESVTAMAKWLGVQAELMDLSTPYWNSVFSPSLDEWSRGWTPNPDVMCNREIKFGELLRRIDQDMALSPSSSSTAFGRRQTKRWLVTGHYAGLQYYSPALQPHSTHGRLLRAMDQSKDQSYFLSAVSSQSLGRTHFPLSKMSKVQVRQLARSLGMPTAESEESMGICFVGERRGGASQKKAAVNLRDRTEVSTAGFAQFLGGYIEPKLGDIVTVEGQVMGKHKGLHTVTIGQGARISGAKERYFVAAKNLESNQVIVVPGNNHAWLQCHSLQVSSFAFINKDEAEKALQSGRILAQVRHRQSAVPCKAFLDGGSTIKVQFDPPILSVAEGQVCALYHDQQCLGSGVITKVETQATRQAQDSPS